MDEQKSPFSLNTLCGQTDTDAPLLDSVCGDSSVVYFCSAEEIGEGFTIALRAMGYETEILLSDIIPQSDTPSKEKR